MDCLFKEPNPAAQPAITGKRKSVYEFKEARAPAQKATTNAIKGDSLRSLSSVAVMAISKDYESTCRHKK
jgi:hypothetical protein